MTVDRDALPEICIVVAPLGLSPGKLVGQAFQAAVRGLAGRSEFALWTEWHAAGTRTIVRFAKTPAIFDRVCKEVPGFTMCDEGFTEVEPETTTLFVSVPFLHCDRPKVLDNKKLSSDPH